MFDDIVKIVLPYAAIPYHVRSLRRTVCPIRVARCVSHNNGGIVPFPPTVSVPGS